MSEAVKLYERHTVAELTAMAEAIRADPASANPNRATGDIHIYTQKARKKLDAIAWAITYHLQDKKAEQQTTSTGKYEW